MTTERAIDIYWRRENEKLLEIDEREYGEALRLIEETESTEEGRRITYELSKCWGSLEGSLAYLNERMIAAAQAWDYEEVEKYAGFARELLSRDYVEYGRWVEKARSGRMGS